jgi:hypothetical protein
MIVINYEGSGRALFESKRQNFSQEAEESPEKFEDIRFSGRDSDPAPPKYGTRDLITQQGCLIVFTFTFFDYP